MRTHAVPKPCRICGEPVNPRYGLATRVHRACRNRETAQRHPKPERPALPPCRLTREVSQEGQTRPSMDIAKGNHRSEALRRSANGEACVACGKKDGSTVWAHSDEQAHGKGTTIKAHDLLGNYFCGDCHFEYGHGNKLTREQKWAMFRECYPRTMVRVAEKLAAGELRL